MVAPQLATGRFSCHPEPASQGGDLVGTEAASSQTRPPVVGAAKIASRCRTRSSVSGAEQANLRAAFRIRIYAKRFVLNGLGVRFHRFALIPRLRLRTRCVRDDTEARTSAANF